MTLLIYLSPAAPVTNGRGRVEVTQRFSESLQRASMKRCSAAELTR